MGSFAIVCLFCLLGVSFGTSWMQNGFMGGGTLEAWAFSRTLNQLEFELTCTNSTRGILADFTSWDIAGLLGPVLDQCANPVPESKSPSGQNAPGRRGFSRRRHNVAFHPVLFDDMFSIDKRGNTLHFVDDATSVARSAYPIMPSVCRTCRALLEMLKYALPFGLNIAST